MANYLYNGVELPDINTVWTDKETYPYAHIIYYANYDIYTMRYHKGPISYTAYYESTGTPALIGIGSYFAYDAKDNSWEFYQNIEDDDAAVLSKSSLVWSSRDILNIDDGSVYLAASDPIPVNPAPTLDPTSLLMGWQVGNRIRQRTKGATE